MRLPIETRNGQGDVASAPRRALLARYEKFPRLDPTWRARAAGNPLREKDFDSPHLTQLGGWAAGARDR